MSRTAGRVIVGTVVVLAGALAVVGSTRKWLDAFTGEVLFGKASLPGTASGLDIVWGKVALGAGAVIVIGGVLTLIMRTGRLGALLALLGGAVAAASAALVFADPERAFVDFAKDWVPSSALPGELVETTVKQLLAPKGAEVTVGIGPYLVVAGGALAVIVGVFGLIWGRGRKNRSTPAGRPQEA
jgi:hypothetical protein